MAVSLHLYRQVLREATHFRPRPVGRKIAFNTREVFEARRDERFPAAIERMHGDAQAALRVIAWLKALPPVRAAAARAWSPVETLTETCIDALPLLSLRLLTRGARSMQDQADRLFSNFKRS